jgi:hypothetical protein
MSGVDFLKGRGYTTRSRMGDATLLSRSVSEDVECLDWATRAAEFTTQNNSRVWEGQIVSSRFGVPGIPARIWRLTPASLFR